MQKQMKRIIIGLLCIVLLNIGDKPLTSNAATSGKDIIWEKISKESESGNLTDITYNKKKIYIAVGDEGTILRSSNGLDWKRVSMQTTSNFKSITTNGEEFVAVGSDGMIIKSKNGSSWSKATVTFNKKLTYQNITGKNQKYNDKNYNINWKKQPKQNEVEFRDVIWDGKKYVAVGHWQVDTGSLRSGKYSDFKQASLYSDFVATSSDGMKWKADYTGMENMESVVYTGQNYLITSETQIAYSADLKKWKIATPKVRGTIMEIIYANGKYVMINWDGSVDSMGAAIHTSTNGTTWKSVINPTNLGSLTHKVDDTIKKYGKANGFANLYMRTAIWDGSKYVVAGYKGMVLTSKSGAAWKMLNNSWEVYYKAWGYTDQAGETANINKMVYDGEQYIQVGNNGTILVTKDLTEGTVVRERLPADYTKVVYDGKNRYFAYGTEESEGVLESANGYSWTKVDFGDNIKGMNTETIVAHNGTALIVGNTSADNGNCFYYYSNKAGDWKKMSFSDEFSYTYGSQYLNGKYHIFTRHGLITSTDGKKWSGYSLTNTMPQKIITNGKTYVGIRATHDFSKNIWAGSLYISTNYNKWTSVKVKKGGKSYYLSAADVVWTGKKFVTIGGKLLEDDIFSNDYVVATSSDGKKWSIQDSEKDYVAGTYGNKTFLAFDNGGDLYVSTDGVKYTKKSKITSQKLAGGLWDGKKFIIVGEMGVMFASSKSKNDTIPKQNDYIENKRDYILKY